MLRKIFSFLFVITTLLIITQCDKELDTLVGSEFFERDNMGSVNYASFQAATSDTFYQTQILIADSPYLYVGEANGIKAKSILRFSGELGDNTQVDSARVTFHTNATIGADQGAFTASVHLIATDWDDSQLSWETANNGFIGEEIATIDFDAEEMSNGDTLAFSFLVPKETIQAWMDTTQDVNYGLIFNYTNPSFMVQLFGNHTNHESGLWPVLDIHYTVNDTTQSTSTLLTSKDTYVTVSEQEPTQDYLVISNGVSSRPVLYFDVSSIDSQATINQAKLVLFADTSRSFPIPHENFYELYTFRIEDPDDIFTTESVDAIQGYLIADSLVVNITYYVQNWTSGLTENHGLFLKGRYEKQELQQRAFLSSTAVDTTLRPTLHVYYSLPPSGRL